LKDKPVSAEKSDLLRAQFKFDLWMHRLSDSHRVLMNALASGDTQQKIAASLGISTKTIQRKIDKWCTHLNISSSSDLYLRWRLHPDNIESMVAPELRAQAHGVDLAALINSSQIEGRVKASERSAVCGGEVSRRIPGVSGAHSRVSSVAPNKWLNPIFWDQVLRDAGALKTGRTSLRNHEEYRLFASQVWGGEKNNRLRLDQFDKLMSNNPRLWLLSALTARAMGGGLTEAISEYEVEYLSDTGYAWRRRCEREDTFTMTAYDGLVEGMVSRKAGIAFWTEMFPCMLARTRTPSDLQALNRAVSHPLCPIIGMVVQTFALASSFSSGLPSEDDTAEPWSIWERWIAAQRVSFVKELGIEPSNLLKDW
jgi:hypothetical protein